MRAAWYDAIAEMFADLYPDGPGRSASPVDLMIAAAAAHHGLVVLHDDADYRVVARHAPDLDEHSVHEVV